MIISIGFYTVMWGKMKEEMVEDDCGASHSGSEPNYKVPLLQNRKADEV